MVFQMNEVGPALRVMKTSMKSQMLGGASVYR